MKKSQRPHLSDVYAMHDDIGTVLPTQADLHDGCNDRHNHRHRDVQTAPVEGQSECVIPCTGRNNSNRLLFLMVSKSKQDV